MISKFTTNTIRRVLFLVAIAGLAISGYLFVTYTTGAPILCGLDIGCDAVRASEYSSLLGLPTPLYGLVFYAALAAGAAFLPSWHSAWLRLCLMVLTGIGVAVSAWLTYLEAYVIQAWCIWCIASAILTLVAFGLVWGKLTLYGTNGRN